MIYITTIKKLNHSIMKKWYRIIPVIGYIIEMNMSNSITEGPYFQLYHVSTGAFIGLILTILFL